MATKKKPNNITYFSVDNSLMSAEFEAGSDDSTIVKKALVMVEGEHVDSAKKRHVFSPSRIQRIVENTNEFLSKGGRVPWQRDHKKDQESNIGDLEGPLEIRVITEQDLPNKRLRHLVGKVGAFTTALVAKGRDVVDELVAGRIKTLSPGIDITQDLIREISATPTPAIVGLSIFSRAAQEAEGNFALTMDEAEAENQQMDELEEQFEDLSKLFWEVVENISTATEEDLQGADPTEYVYQAMDDYMMRIQGLLGLDQEQPSEDQMQQQMAQQAYGGQGVGGSQMPGYIPQQQGFANMSRYYNSGNASKPVLAAFSMAEMEALEQGTANFARTRGAKDKKKRMSKGMMAGAGVGAVGLGAAARYGTAEVNNRKQLSETLRTGLSPSARGKRIRNTFGDDVAAVRSGASKLGSKIKSGASGLGSSIRGQARALPLELKNARMAARGGFAKGAGASKGIGRIAKGSLGAARAMAGTGAGRAALGLGAVGALGAGAALGYRALKNRKKR